MFVKTTRRVLLAATFAYVAVCSWLYFSQRSMLYFPTPAIANVQAEAFELQNDGLRLKGWAVNPGKQRAMIYFGGNAEAVEYNAEVFKTTLPDVTVYLLPYRSYGGNPGELTEENVYSDALELYDQIKSRHNSISVLGRSLGSGVATYLASERKIDKLVLVTPYDSMVNVAKAHYPAFPVSFIIKDRYESWRRASRINSKVLVVIAGTDEIIPRASTDNLLRHFKRKPNVIVFDGAGHNTPSDSTEYDKAVSEFIDQ